ncbi:hypothetical protein B0H17DRAFT_1136028 [Mycena rosella]|uniref:Methyltransferase n=1 Tax=Mycena rosella TaxID=1033263 RepID=A0AAD7DC93_MYCRO|nr:hypothetical protein B0H17DRAFT_1136028 [Mycena rosella]
MAPGTPASTTASIVFALPPPDGTRAYQDTTAPNGANDKNFPLDVHDVEIQNLRGTEATATLDTTGFQLYKHAAKHTAFTSDAEIKEEYYPESIELLKRITGASRVVLFDHTIRRRKVSAIDDSTDTAKPAQPATQAHIDQTNAAALVRLRLHMPAEEVPELLKHRFQIINLWRPISHPALDWPLALCDYRSFDGQKDVLPVALIFPDREGEASAVIYNPNQKWTYFSGVAPDELILIKCYDSLQDGSVALYTPHTAFSDPATPEGAPFRESIELRAFVFYD